MTTRSKPAAGLAATLELNAGHRSRLLRGFKECSLGMALVNQCEGVARQRGCRRIRLWTHSVLAARAIDWRAGCKLRSSEPHHGFGHDLVGKTWELALD